MQAGRDREWSKPFNANADDHEPHGTHVGPYSCFNVVRPRPGFKTAYAHRDDPGGFNTMQMMGYRPVLAENPDGTKLSVEASQFFGAPQDGLVGMGKLVLMEIPLDQYAAHIAREEEQRRKSQEGPTRSFLDKQAEFDHAYGRRPARVGSVYALPEHGVNGYLHNDSLEDR